MAESSRSFSGGDESGTPDAPRDFLCVEAVMRLTGFRTLPCIAPFACVAVVLVATGAPHAGDAGARPAARPSLTILHTGDLHGHVTGWRGWEGELDGRTLGGMDRIAGVVRRVRNEVGRDRVLLLDSGDAVSDTMVAKLTKGSVVIDAMSAAGYDAMTFGNHEPDFGVSRLRELMKRARFPLVAVNVHEAPGSKLFARPWVILERGGVKVGVVGFAYANTPLTTARKNVEGLAYSYDPGAIRSAVEEVRRRGATVVVLLSHAGLAADRRLAAEVTGIDVIAGGHSHNRLSDALEVGGTLIVSAGAHGSHVGRLDLTLRDGRVAEHRRELIAVDHASVPADPEVAALLEKLMAPHRAALDEPIGITAERIVRAQTLAGDEPEKRNELSPADALFATILRQETRADVALLPGVGYGVAIGPGPITAAALRNLIPHDSRAVTMVLEGRQVREILEQSVHNVYTDDPREKVGGMIQVSGLSFRYDPSRPRGARVVEVRVGGEPLDDTRALRVVTNGMLAEGGHAYRTFLEGKERREGAEVHGVVKKWLESGSAMPTLTDTIERVGGPGGG